MSISQKKCWDYEWPKDSLESVLSCPACKSEKCELLMDDLVDNTFFVAPGKWKLFKCLDCESAYLNPRPNRKSIYKAYGDYYTHEIFTVAEAVGKTSFIKRLWRQLVNGYYNYHYGTRRKPFIHIGAWLLFFFPKFRSTANAKFRYLPKPKPGQKLLDVGCGNGDYLLLASEAGWQVKGLEPDPKARELVKARGLELAQGSFEKIVKTGEQFDVITMSHVIEHVHDPVSFVKLAHKCLKPGGIMYIDTPNIESYGAKRFGRNWRGVETPRHLILLSMKGLESIISQVSFQSVKFMSRPTVRMSMELRSYRMEQGYSQFDKTINKLPFLVRTFLSIPRKKNREEFLTIIATK